MSAQTQTKLTGNRRFLTNERILQHSEMEKEEEEKKKNKWSLGRQSQTQFGVLCTYTNNIHSNRKSRLNQEKSRHGIRGATSFVWSKELSLKVNFTVASEH